MTATAVAPRPVKRYFRHWKERFKAGMPLIFIRRVRLDANRTMNPGDPVTPELRAELGEHRMKMWWTAKRLGCPERSVVTVPAAPATDPHALKDVPCGLNVGDDKTLEDAKNKFDNKPNFGGKPLGGKGKKG